MSTETVRPDDPAERPPSRLTSSDLLGERREVEIEHNGEIYRLRLTRAGKLILTK
jgi:hemin uptake protein HemP